MFGYLVNPLLLYKNVYVISLNLQTTFLLCLYYKAFRHTVIFQYSVWLIFSQEFPNNRKPGLSEVDLVRPHPIRAQTG